MGHTTTVLSVRLLRLHRQGLHGDACPATQEGHFGGWCSGGVVLMLVVRLLGECILKACRMHVGCMRVECMSVACVDA